MRKLSLMSLMMAAVGIAAAPTASATPTISLEFQSTGTSTTTLSFGETAILDVILVSDVPLITSTFMVSVDTGMSPAPASVTDATNAPAPFSGVPFSVDPKADPDHGYDIGAFGGLSVQALGPFTIDLGDVTFTAGNTPGTISISTYQRPGIDVWYNGAFEIVQPTLGTATLQVVPEPRVGTLLAGGLIFLGALRRRRR